MPTQRGGLWQRGGSQRRGSSWRLVTPNMASGSNTWSTDSSSSSHDSSDDDQDNHVSEPQPNHNAADGDEPLQSTSPTLHQATTTTTSTTTSQKVTIKTHTETTALPAAVSRPHYPTLVTISAPPLQDGEERTPIDLVTILDVSGSMAGRKLDLVKQAMKFVIENLASSDRISLVTFSTTARRVFPLKRMTSEGRLDAVRAVEALRVEDMTNIAAGLKIGAQILKERREKNKVASIMLLSDGQDNRSSEREILKSLPSNKKEIPVHTFGFGHDHDAKTMHAISNASKGTFSYIESVGMIQDGFALCLGGLLSVVAQEVNLEVRAASNSVKITSIPSGRHINEIRDNQGVIHVGNMYAEEVKQFLVYCTVPPNEIALLDVTCTYKDPSSDVLIDVAGKRVVISRPEFCSPAEMEVLMEVDRQRNRILVMDAIGEAQKLAEMGNLKGAREILTHCRETLMASSAAQSGDSLCKMLENELGEVKDRMGSREEYMCSGKAYLCAGMSAHSLQRASARGTKRLSRHIGPISRGGARGRARGDSWGGARGGGGSFGACMNMGASFSKRTEEDEDEDEDEDEADDCNLTLGGAFETPAMIEMVGKSQKKRNRSK